MRICARSDCNSPATAVLTYDRVALTAYLFDIEDPSKRTPGDLCDRHLRRLVLPRSWQLDDRRAAAANPTPEPAVEVPVAAKRVRKPRVKKLRAVPDAPAVPAVASAPRRKWAEVEPSLFDNPVSAAPVATAVAEVDADEDHASEPVWMPRFGPESELDEVLDAKTPLLRRAFGGQ